MNTSGLSILNRQRRLAIGADDLRPRLEALLAAAGVADREVSLVLVSDEAMRLMNRDWRGVDRTTDCLSFPATEGEGGLHAGPVLGDIVVSVPTALRQGREHAPPGTPDDDALRDEVLALFAHSLLHLLGHDHRDANESRRMKARERALLAKSRPAGSPHGAGTTRRSRRTV